MKKTALLLALLLCLSLLACGAEPAQPADSRQGALWGQPVKGKSMISQPEPAEGAQVSLITDYTREFITDYYFGKGPHTVSYKNDVMLKKGPMHQDVTFSWSCSGESTGFTLAYATREDFSDCRTLETEQPSVKVQGLFAGTAYYWQVAAHTAQGDCYSAVFSFTTEATPRIITLDGVVNTRDLGGYVTEDGAYRVRQGLIYRGSNLDDIAGAGMQAAVEIYGIRTDLDLRSPTSDTDHMLYTDKSPILMGEINYINITGVSYSSILPYSQRIRDELLVFTKEENYPIYFHCKAGRDRAGTLAFLLNALLGVPEEKLLMDYELTYLTPMAYASGDLRGHNWMMEFLAGIKMNPGNTLQEKVENYCIGCGLTREDIQAIRDIMLEEI